MKLSQLYKEESHGSFGAFEIEINVSATVLPDLTSDSIQFAAFEAVAIVKSAIMRKVLEANPEAQERKARQRSDLLGMFPSPIFVEEIPNGYCPDWCCHHLPWFIVTTAIGRFKVGWRKRVIHIEWTETNVTKTAEEIFPDERVTKEGRIIHAWSLDDGRRYVQAFLLK